MNLLQLRDQIKKRLQSPLPGGDAHETFRAHPVGDVKPVFDHKIPPKPGGVMILLFENEGEICFPLIKRHEYTGAHSGQVSLPGGKSELHEGVVDTAVRECEEEIGILRANLEVLGTLSDFFVMPSNFMVTPVIAVHNGKPDFKPDSYEVKKIIVGKLDDLLSDGAMRQKEILAAGRFRMLAPHFEIEEEVVWGATAMMLNEFRIVVKEAKQMSFF